MSATAAIDLGGLDAVTARLQTIRSMAASLGIGAPASSPSSTSFAGALADASAPAAAAASGTAAAPAATGAAATSLPAGTPFGADIEAAAARNGVDPALLAGLVRQESGFDPSARSPVGAVGLTQLMPATAAGLGVTDPTDPRQALEGGAKYLRAQLDHFGGDVAKALAAYNAGPGAVERFGGVPPYPETQNYVRNVMAFADQARAGRPMT